ncbi:uncharacterized protein LOC135479004 [Liolophura sinensis]|uniref:uncharacterized protein LOC135479004 n=1 Tax=Liolophura sinensis TaxID=3198878 RepID=UPI00315977E6
MMGRMLNSAVSNAFYLVTYLWKVLGIVFSLQLLGLRRLCSPSSETKQKVLAVVEKLKKKEDAILDDISALPPDEDVLAVTDSSGYNALQHAVISGDVTAIKGLLRLGFNPDSAVCSPAIHIAAHLGNQEMVKSIIAFGARLDREVGMCFPHPHVPVYFRDNYLGLSQHPVHKCHDRKRSPIQCAIDGDHVSVVKSISKAMGYRCSPSTTLPAQLIQYSCRMGSLECIKHFVNMWPELIEEQDANGDSPLMLAVPWGQNHVRFLIDKGANMRKVSKLGETVLHRLYRNTKDGYFSIFDTTKFLLTAGLEEDVNMKDFKEETPLHILVGHLAFVLKDVCSSVTDGSSLEQVQNEYQKQVVQCMGLLLQYNADIKATNAKKHQPLSKLLHITVAACDRRDPHPCIFLDPGDEYFNNFAILNDALKVLLSHGADPNAQCALGHTSLLLLLQCLLYGCPKSLCSQAENFLHCLETLLSHGAEPNFTTQSQATCSTLLARIGQRSFSLNQSRNGEDVTLHEQFSKLLNRCLRLLLQHGLNPNHTTTKRSRHLQGGTGNALIEFVRLAEHATLPRDLKAVHDWLKTLLQWGGDPDIEPYPSDPIICHSQSSIFLKKQASQPVNHYIHEVKDLQSIFDHGHALDLLLLFYHTMDHRILFECLRSAKFMSHFHPMGATGQDFLSALNELTDNPRSLKNSARVVIYKALNRSLAKKIPQLPLPKRVQHYLLDIEH